MRRLLFLLVLLLPVMTQARMNVLVEVFDASTREPLPDVLVWLGNYTEVTDENGTAQWILDTSCLRDTLRLQHAGYAFDTLTLSHYDYSVTDERLRVAVFARRKEIESYQLDLFVSRRKKEAYGTIQIEAFCPQAQGNIKVCTPEGQTQFILTGNSAGNYSEAVSRSVLEDGFFVFATEHGLDSMPFVADQWRLLYDLTPAPPRRPMQNREVMLITRHFDAMADADLSYHQMVQAYEDSLIELNQEVCDLENYIKELLFGDVYWDVMAPAEVEPLEIEPQEFIEFAEGASYPEKGMGEVLRSLSVTLSGQELEFSGEVVLRLKVSKRGIVSGKILHASSEAEALAQLAIDTLRAERWIPAMHLSRPVDESFDLTLNLKKQR